MSEFSDGFHPHIDRYDRRSAEKLFRRIWPDEDIARASSAVLAQSIRRAHRAGAECWSITMFSDRVRLNVGQVETLTFGSHECHLVFRGRVEPQTGKRFRIIQTNKPVYASVRGPSGICMLAPENLPKLPNSVLSAHQAYIEAAAAVKRRSPFKDSFSPSILEYLEDTLDELLPRPTYVKQETSPHIEPLPEELNEPEVLFEGARYQVTVNAYERDPEARRQCIARQGTQCAICGFSFGAAYGKIAEGFIHVHHLRPLAEIGRKYRIDPNADLRPVCPNCHAVLHLRSPPYCVEEVRRLLRKDKAGNPPANAD
jgi:5-methylcytosine-specific restriction enzyme A